MDKYINKLIENRWFIRIIALILALLLYENVNQENQSVVNVPQDKDMEVIENIPVKGYYDAENLVVTGIPEVVTITLSGPKSNLQQAITQKGFEVFVDLTDAEIGKRKVPLQIKGISDRLNATIDPQSVIVSIQEKMTQEFSVEAEYNRNIVAEGYLAEEPSIKPNKVKITGAKDLVERVTYVKATLDVNEPLKETVTKEADILVLDENLNKLNVEVVPSRVAVTLPVKASSKSVPIKLDQKGNPPSGVSIRSITMDKEEATIIAPESVLKNTESVRVELDVSNIKEDTIMTLPVIISDGVVEVNPRLVKVNVRVSSQEDKTVSSLPIHIEGLLEKYKASIREPSNGTTSVVVTGRREDISSISTSDFNVYVDASNLGVGEHDVPIKVDGPNNVKWKTAIGTVKLTITETEA